MLLKKSLVIASAVATAGAALVLVSPPASADTDIAGTYNAITPTRVLDTRDGTGTGTPNQTIAARSTLTVKVTNPLQATAASAVALTVTVVTPAAAGFLAAYAGGTDRPASSNLNFRPGSNTPNSVVLGVPDDGTVTFYNGSTGTISLLADLYGFWSAGSVDPATGGAFTAVDPVRTFDTRASGNTAIPSRSSGSASLAAAELPEDATAVFANVTVAGPTRAGFASADSVPADGSPQSSSINFGVGESRANLVLVPINTDGTISLYNGSAAALNVAVDVFGYISGSAPSDDGAFVASSPYRAADTAMQGSPLGAKKTLKVSLFPADSGTFKAVAVNLTATSSTKSGYLVPYSGSGSLPPISASNYQVGQARATTVVVPVNDDGSISIYNGSIGTVRVIVDVEGFALNNDSANLSDAQAHRRIETALRNARAYSAAELNR